MSTQQSLFLQNEESLILSQIEELKKDLEAVRRLRSKYSNGYSYKVPNGEKIISPSSSNDISAIKPIEIPSKYDKNVLTWEQRCVFILNELGKATVEDVIKKLKEYQPEVSNLTAKNVVTNKLSKLNRTKKINADKSGKKYIYYL